jgi:hypothetical protein
MLITFDKIQGEIGLGWATLHIIYEDMIWKRCVHNGPTTWCSNTDRSGLSSIVGPPQWRHHRCFTRLVAGDRSLLHYHAPKKKGQAMQRKHP